MGDVIVTTIDRAAASGVRKPVARTAVLMIAALGLAGCETGSSLFAGGGASTTPVAEQLPPPGTAQKAKIAVAPIVGPPDATSRSLQAQVAAALERQKVTVAKQATDPSEYTLRGYVVSAKEKASTKVSYIWDVTDPTGKRVNRITGEEVAPGAGASKDTWAAVTPQIVDQIANKTASSLITWLPTQSSMPPAATPAAPAASVPVANAAPLATPAATPVAAASTMTAAPAPGATTGSIGRPGSVMATVPNVSGAPGDGSVALTGAIQRELARNGVALSSGGATTYKVEGKVSVGAVKDGKQAVAIDWHVKDPTGKQLGTVSQKNEVPQGSLDGPWGKTADAAAAAAAQGIIKLLPKAN